MYLIYMCDLPGDAHPLHVYPLHTQPKPPSSRSPAADSPATLCVSLRPLTVRFHPAVPVTQTAAATLARRCPPPTASPRALRPQRCSQTHARLYSVSIATAASSLCAAAPPAAASKLDTSHSLAALPRRPQRPHHPRRTPAPQRPRRLPRHRRLPRPHRLPRRRRPPQPRRPPPPSPPASSCRRLGAATPFRASSTTIIKGETAVEDKEWVPNIAYTTHEKRQQALPLRDLRPGVARTTTADWLVGDMLRRDDRELHRRVHMDKGSSTAMVLEAEDYSVHCGSCSRRTRRRAVRTRRAARSTPAHGGRRGREEEAPR